MKVKLGDLTKIKTGKLDANASSEDGQYPFFTCSREPLKISNYSYDCECVLVAGNGDLNVKYYNGKFDAYQRTYIIEDNSGGQLYMPYLYYFMEGYIKELRRQAIGGVIKYIKLGNLTDALMELPSVDAQKKIVNILKKAKQLLSLSNNEILKLDELVNARFVEMFVNINVKWKEVAMTDICKDMRTGPFGSALHHDEFVDKGIFVLGIDNAVENKFSYNRMRYITEEKYEKLKRYTVHPGDVIITIMGTIGRSAVVPKDMPKAINTKHLACLTPDTNMVDSYFLVNAFQIHPLIRHQLESQSKGAIMNGLNLKIIKGLKFRLPPLELQKEFVDFYNQVDKSKVAIQKALDKTQMLFDSLMQEYFG